jgi:hypothetical protein
MEGFIPAPSTPANFESISEAFEATFKERVRSDLALATAVAGEILAKMINEFTPRVPLAALPTRKVLDKGIDSIYRKLRDLDYWDAFCSRALIFSKSEYLESEVIWLYSLQALWKKRFTTDVLFSIGATKWGRRHRHLFEDEYPP